MSADLDYMYRRILSAVGGAGNIAALGCCITRLRIIVKNEKLLDVNALRLIRGIKGYVRSGVQHHLIVGPSVSSKLFTYFNERQNFPSLEEIGAQDDKAFGGQPSSQATAFLSRPLMYRITAVCGRIGSIFLPLIPAYIGCGLITGIGNVLSKTILVSSPNITTLIQVLGQSVFFYLMAIVGYNANKEFGGSPALGLAFAGVLNAPALSKITLFGLNFTPGEGGVLAVLLVCWVGSWVERKLRSHLRENLEMFLTPLITIFVVGTLALLFIQPVAGFAADILAKGTRYLLQHGGLWIGAFLGGTFLPLVMLGLHQSLIPIHQQLLDSLGTNPLLPILCMAGAGQVGAGLAVLFKTHNAPFKTLIKNAIPVGLLGIGEPLIYGVTLPLFKPFVAACIGGAFGGAVVAFFQTGASIPFGVSGVVMLMALSNLHSTLFYTLGYVTAVVVGFVATCWLGFDDPEPKTTHFYP